MKRCQLCVEDSVARKGKGTGRKQLFSFFEGRNKNGNLVREKEDWFYVGELI